MAKILNWNTAEFEAQCIGVTMDRLEVAAQIIADDMKTTLRGQVVGNWREHGPYDGGSAPLWTARRHDALAKTIRVVRKTGDTSRNIWIIAGNWAVWWALQTEYGRGGWKGGKKSFMRPAMKKAGVAIQTALEGGSGQTKGFEGYR